MSTFYPFAIELDGRKHQGQWALKQGGKLCVGGFYGSRTVEIEAGQPVNVAAADVLRELVIAWRETQRERAPGVERKPTEDRPFALTVLADGRSWSGTWTLLGGRVFVSSAYGSKRAPVRRSAPERLAERLMKEIVKEWQAGR